MTKLSTTLAVFEFFADATNLEALTPPSLRFRITTDLPIDMGVGTTIDYDLRVHGIAVRWQSEISLWRPSYGFVDVQRHGPYCFWRHEHAFREDGRDTVVFDQVRYRAPGGWLANHVFVARDLKLIFRYRHARLDTALGGSAS